MQYALIAKISREKDEFKYKIIEFNKNQCF